MEHLFNSAPDRSFRTRAKPPPTEFHVSTKLDLIAKPRPVASNADERLAVAGLDVAAEIAATGRPQLLPPPAARLSGSTQPLSHTGQSERINIARPRVL
jgi:hypothetical protein